MIPLYDLMLKAQNGGVLDVMAKQFGLAQKQANEAISALMPAFSEGMKRSAANPYDFGTFLKALYSGDYAKYFDDVTTSPRPSRPRASRRATTCSAGSSAPRRFRARSRRRPPR
jgi:hypothetical protein